MEVFLLRFWLKALYSLFWTFLEEFSTIMFILWTKLKTSSVNHEDVLHTFYMSSFKTLIAKLLENSIILVLDLQLRSISKQTSAKQMVSVMIIILFVCGTSRRLWWSTCLNLTLLRLVFTKRSYILTQTCIWKLQVCLSMYDLLVDTWH